VERKESAPVNTAKKGKKRPEKKRKDTTQLLNREGKRKKDSNKKTSYDKRLKGIVIHHEPAGNRVKSRSSQRGVKCKRKGGLKHHS